MKQNMRIMYKYDIKVIISFCFFEMWGKAVEQYRSLHEKHRPQFNILKKKLISI